MSSTSLFCSHKRLRTTCPDCRQEAVASAAATTQPLTPVRPQKAEPAPRRASAAGAAAASGDEEGKEPRKKGGHMLPKRTRQRTPATRAEAEKAEAWWVKK